MGWNPWRARRERRLDDAERFRAARRLADDDVTVLGEQLADLHTDTLADDLDDVATHHYRQALEGYEHAKEGLRTAETVEHLVAATQLAEDSRYHRACVLAVRDGVALPERREPCFFDPRHGPSTTDVPWAPPDGAERQVSVCASDARRLAGGEQPDVRMVRVGDRYVPWHQVGGMSALVHHHQSLAHERSLSHNRFSQLQADLGRMDNIGGFPGI